MPYDPNKHHRRSIRLKSYDYTTQGAYFVTICVYRRECVLGEVIGGDMRLNDWGQAVAASWLWLDQQYPYVTLDSWIVMPNHLHGIVAIQESGLQAAPADGTSKRKSLGRLIGAFKTVSTKRINAMRGDQGIIFWQRNYWEHIIRNETERNQICTYIQDNPARWSIDQLHPAAPPNRFNQE